MTTVEVLAITRDLITTAVILAAPAVLTSLIVGLLVTLLQTITSIQEQTLSFVPRILAVCFVLIVTLPWTLKVVTGFAVRMLTHASGAGP